MPRDIAITDPTFAPGTRKYNALERLALRYLDDERDLPFIWVMLQITLVLIPCAIALYIPGVAENWWLGPIYWALIIGLFLDRYILMLHCTSHRRLFKKQYPLLNYYIPWCLGPFLGETPDTYFVHHIGMHHPENNLEADLSSTMRYKRDSLLGWVHYVGRFFLFTFFELAAYQWKRRRQRLLRRMLIGELGWYICVGGLLFLNWQATLIVFVVPFVLTRALMMAGNWGQHAFIDAADPGNCYTNSITCINSRYNRRAFNDGYHIGHHIKPFRHWTEMPEDFQRNIDKYAANKALVLEGVDFFIVWLLLMFKRYNGLAKRVVQLGDVDMSRAEIVALLRERTRPIRRPRKGDADAAQDTAVLV